MSRVYGKRTKRSFTRLAPAIELSPVKNRGTERSADHIETPSANTDDDHLKPLTSPFQSPQKVHKRRLVSPREKKINKLNRCEVEDDIFALREAAELVKPASRSTRSLRTKQMKGEPPLPQTTSLNSYFVESKSKPAWSPSMSPKMSQRSSPDAILAESSPQNKTSAVRKLTFPPFPELKKPLPKNEDPEGWDLLDSIDEPKMKVKTKLLKKVSLRSPRSSQSSVGHEQEIIKLFNSQSQSTEESEETPPPATSPHQIQVKELTESPKLKRTAKIYGYQRSYRAQRDEENYDKGGDTDNDLSEGLSGGEEENIQNGNDSSNVQTFAHLRAQGLSAQSLDELNFLIEGIQSSSSKVSGLLDLSLKLFDDEFCKVIKCNGLSNLHHIIDKEDELQRYLLAFILCKVSEDPHDLIEFDADLIDIVVKLLMEKNDIQAKKGSKSMKLAFKEFQEKLNADYDGVFLGLTLLLQNSSFVNNDIYEALCDLLKKPNELNCKSYQIILILLESYFTNNDSKVNASFISKIQQYKYEADLNVHVLTLKLLIVLSAKKIKEACVPSLVVKSLRLLQDSDDDHIRLLYFGLFINLAEDPKCLKVMVTRANLRKLHDVYAVAGELSTGYFAMLVGILFNKYPLQVRTHFDTHELENIQLQLQRFDHKGNKNIKLQVETILTSFSI